MRQESKKAFHQDQDHHCETLLRQQQSNLVSGAFAENQHLPFAILVPYAAPLELFDGASRDQPELESWLFRAETLARLARASEDHVTILTAGHLTGKALTWYHSFDRDYKKGHTQESYIPWEVFRQGMIAEFGDPTYERKMRDKWAELKQKSSMKEYIDNFRDLRIHLKVTEDGAMDKFLRGLKQDVRRQVESYLPDNVNHAIRLADTCDYYSNDSKSKRKTEIHKGYHGSRETRTKSSDSVST